MHAPSFTVRRVALLAMLAAAPLCLGPRAQGEGPDQRKLDPTSSPTNVQELEQAGDVDPAEAVKHGLHVGVTVADITPPEGFPMAGYYHERLAEGTIDPLRAKAIVFRDGDTAAALVVCDLIGIATDLSREVRRRASERTGIPSAHNTSNTSSYLK